MEAFKHEHVRPVLKWSFQIINNKLQTTMEHRMRLPANITIVVPPTNNMNGELHCMPLVWSGEYAIYKLIIAQNFLFMID